MEAEKGLRKKSKEQRTFLSRWVNLSDDLDMIDGFWAAYKGWFRVGAFDLAGRWESKAREGWGGETPTTDSMKAGRNAALLEMRNDMRDAWDTANHRDRQWKLHPLRYKLNRLSAPDENQLNQAPPPSEADAALIYLESVAHKLKTCDNADCRVERYLIGVKKMPRFCGNCSNVARGLFKANWWKKRRKELNAKRRDVYRKKNRGKSGGKRAPKKTPRRKEK